jgi:hypothetical protein
MCPGYTNRKSTEVSRAFAKKVIDLQNQKREEAFRHATLNPRDPMSKGYLPNLYGKKKEE